MIQRDRRRDLGKRKNAALLGRFNGIGAHALEIDPRDLAMTGEDRLQPRHAHFDGLLHHVIEPRRFERCEQVVQVQGLGLGTRLGGDGERHRALGALREARAPFAITAVKDQHRLARFEPQHMGQVMRLGAIEDDARPRREAGVDVKTRAFEIVAGHGHSGIWPLPNRG